MVLLLSTVFASGRRAPDSRLRLPLEQRLETPLRVGGASVSLPDFVGFIATVFKVPVLVETTSPVPDVTTPAGTFSARQLLDIAVGQMRGYAWNPDNGVVHVFQPALASANGNLLNIVIDRFYFPNNVADFLMQFRQCIYATIQGYGCLGGAFTGVMPRELSQEPLPYLEPFKNVKARAILLRALAANKHFYVLIAFDSVHPKRTSEFPFINWFTESLVPNEPMPMWVQRPQRILDDSCEIALSQLIGIGAGDRIIAALVTCCLLLAAYNLISMPSLAARTLG